MLFGCCLAVQTPNTKIHIYPLNSVQPCQSPRPNTTCTIHCRGHPCYQKIATKAQFMLYCKEKFFYIKVDDQWLFHAAHQSQH
ncbi:hypothetical protein GYH30_036522 [Glycine max]|uniref:Uncharacterized protein n=1 Tax=Glycine max TaxID=3847 RepID=K7M0A4_SOYBN|nr:hypothetical protein GYH30_036522 [Glycine max]